jgi:hypothetical protein
VPAAAALTLSADNMSPLELCWTYTVSGTALLVVAVVLLSLAPWMIDNCKPGTLPQFAGYCGVFAAVVPELAAAIFLLVRGAGVPGCSGGTAVGPIASGIVGGALLWALILVLAGMLAALVMTVTEWLIWIFTAAAVYPRSPGAGGAVAADVARVSASTASIVSQDDLPA